jgi:NTP pyrophosphatase (non-canonical NTP hydrolase)
LEKREVTFGTFEEAIQKTEVPDKISSFTVYQLGLAGEIGELLTEFKKDKRGDVGDVGHKSAVCNELGDCLWYLAQLCNHCGSLPFMRLLIMIVMYL